MSEGKDIKRKDGLNDNSEVRSFAYIYQLFADESHYFWKLVLKMGIPTMCCHGSFEDGKEYPDLCWNPESNDFRGVVKSFMRTLLKENTPQFSHLYKCIDKESDYLMVMQELVKEEKEKLENRLKTLNGILSE